MLVSNQVAGKLGFNRQPPIAQMFWWEPGVFTASSILALLIARVSTPNIGTDSSDQQAASDNRN